MTLPRLTKQQAIEQLTTELKAKVAADFRAKEMRYDYKTIISHYINRIGEEHEEAYRQDESNDAASDHIQKQSYNPLFDK